MSIEKDLEKLNTKLIKELDKLDSEEQKLRDELEAVNAKKMLLSEQFNIDSQELMSKDVPVESE